MNEIKEDAIETSSATTFGLMKYVHLTFMVGTFAAGWLLTKIIHTLWTVFNLNLSWVPSVSFPIAVLIGAGTAISLGFYLWKNPQVNRLVIEIVTELSKVTWPTRKELYASTIVVIVVSVIAAVILGIYDYFWSWLTDFIY